MENNKGQFLHSFFFRLNDLPEFFLNESVFADDINDGPETH